VEEMQVNLTYIHQAQTDYLSKELVQLY